MSPVAYVGIGANLGDPVAAVSGAIAALAARGPTRASYLYRTEPLGDPGQPWYVNAVAEHVTALDPLGLMRELQALERRAGRPARSAGRPSPRARWAPRVLDLDLLLYGDRVCEGPDLVLPHPGVARRRFVLEPLAELAPEVRDPRSGLTARELLAALDDPLSVEKLPHPIGTSDGAAPAAGARPGEPTT